MTALRLVIPSPIWERVSLPLFTQYPFNAGTANSVTLLNLTHSTWVVADAVKFESVARYNNGAFVTSVTLEGQDGIVLLSGIDMPHKVYLPLVERYSWQ